jgi:hypothetical protein
MAGHDASLTFGRQSGLAIQARRSKSTLATRRVIPLVTSRISRREYAVVYRARLPDQTGSLAIRP